MQSITNLENLPCEYSYINDKTCKITFTLNPEILPAFVLIMQSMTGLFRGLVWRGKTNIDAIHERVNESAPVIEAKRNIYDRKTCAYFNQYIEDGKNPKESLSLTVEKLKKEYGYASYDNVKYCLSKNKLLKKTGFYKSRHKYSFPQVTM